MRLSLCFTLIVYFITHTCSGQPSPADTTRYVRLIFIADCFSPAENSSFNYAAANLMADYEKDQSIHQTIKRIHFHSGKQIVDSINHQRSIIKSVDFLSHAQNDRIGALDTGRGPTPSPHLVLREISRQGRIISKIPSSPRTIAMDCASFISMDIRYTPLN